MNQHVLAVASIGLGLSCLALSFAWTTITGPPKSWDESRAIAHTQSGTDFHRRSFAGNGQPTAEQQAALDASQHEWQRSQAELRKLQRRPTRIVLGLRIAGICLALLGAGLGRVAKG